MNNIIFYKYLFKDILIELNIDYFHIENISDYEITKYSNIFNILAYYNVFNHKNIEFNVFLNPKESLEYLVELSNKYNNTQQVLLIVYSYIISYYLNKEHYNITGYQNRFFKKYNINYKNEIKTITKNTLELSVLEYKFLDELYRFSSNYPGIENYHRASISNFDLLEHNIFLNNKLIYKIVDRKIINIKNSSLIDDDVYIEIKDNIVKIIKEFNKKLH